MKRYLLAEGASAGEGAAQLDFKKGFTVGKAVLPVIIKLKLVVSTYIQRAKVQFCKKKGLFASEPQVLIDENLLTTLVF